MGSKPELCTGAPRWMAYANALLHTQILTERVAKHPSSFTPHQRTCVLRI